MKNAKQNLVARASAFTLVEILIVISIILIVSAIGAGAYSSARKSLALDLETDRIVAMLHSMRTAAQIAQRNAAPKCHGVKFRRNEEPQKIETAYSDPIHGCEDAENLISTNAENAIVAGNILLDGNSENDLSVLFAPPRGAMKFNRIIGKNAEITIALKRGASRPKVIAINRESGKIEKK